MDKNIKSKVVIIDDNITNLGIARKALCDDYNVVLFKDGEMALAELPKVVPDLILLDVEMPGLNGFDVIRKIKNEMEEPFRSIPVIFLTAKDDGDSEFQGFNLGAVDYVTKPFSSALLKKRVELHLNLHNYSTNLENLVREKTSHIKELQYAIVHALSEVVENRDATTGGHITRTSKFLKALATQAIADGDYADELEGIDVEIYGHASQMHDVGKIRISDNILLKPGKLTDEEFYEMQKHTTYGGEVIKTAMTNVRELAFLEAAEIFATTHHEKWNGRGYPNGLKGKDIPIGGRMMALVDAYDAIISRRPYKEPKTHEQAVEIIVQDSGEHFDPILVKSFLKIADEFKKISIENQ